MYGSVPAPTGSPLAPDSRRNSPHCFSCGKPKAACSAAHKALNTSCPARAGGRGLGVGAGAGVGVGVGVARSGCRDVDVGVVVWVGVGTGAGVGSPTLF